MPGKSEWDSTDWEKPFFLMLEDLALEEQSFLGSSEKGK